MRIDTLTNSYIGAGEDTVFEILEELTELIEIRNYEFPSVGIYRQLPITYILDNEQLKYLADFHKKSSIDIFLIPYQDDYTPYLSRIAIRVEGKKGSLKMLRQGVQKNLLSKWCKIVDVHQRECPNIFKEKINEESLTELKNAFKTARVELPFVEKVEEL